MRPSGRAAEAAGFTRAGTVVDDGAEMICYTRRAPGSGPVLLIPAR
jgi:hypothetical protein